MKVCVIGLGRFGFNVATTLAQHKIEVLAVDNNESIISSIKDAVTQAICINITDENSLISIGVEDMDVVIVAMGENFAQSILITTLLKKRLKVKRVITRCINTIHHEIVSLTGADETIIPELNVGIQLAERLSSPFQQFFRITGEFSMSQIAVPHRFVGKTTDALHLYDNYLVTCVGRKEDNRFISIAPDYIIQENDILLFSGNEDDLIKVARL